jgi:malate synthase
VTAADLLEVACPPDGVTAAGLATNVSVGLRYLVSWLSGTGAAAIDDLMEDAATAEISRAQIWQWVRHGVRLADGSTVTEARVRTMIDEEAARLAAAGTDATLLDDARGVFERVALSDTMAPFLTLPAYELLP